MDEFQRNKKLVEQREAVKQEKYREESKKRLCKISSSKIRTTMIGALDTIERKFKEYNLLSDNNSKSTNEQLLIKRIFDDIRKDILDKGNNQIRNLETEFEQYNIEWKRYTLVLPVKTPKMGGTDE